MPYLLRQPVSIVPLCGCYGGQRKKENLVLIYSKIINNSVGSSEKKVEA